MIGAIALFGGTFLLMLIFDKYRSWIALGSGILFILTGMLPVSSVSGAIDYNVLLMMAGTMGLVELFIESGMPSRMADGILRLVPNVRWAVVCLSLFAGLISAVVDNVATVLMVAPVALAICRKLDTDPIPFVISVAVASNLQGAATLVGDTTAIMLGSALNLTFLDFFWYMGKPSIFFAVELGAILSTVIVYILFRKEKKPITPPEELTPVRDLLPTVLLLGTILLLVCVSFVPENVPLPEEINGILSCTMLAIGLICRVKKERSFKAALRTLKAVDIGTLSMLLGLFLMVGGISHMGVIARAAELLAGLGGSSIFRLYTIIVVASVVISAFIDNIPYVAAMIPVIGAIAGEMGCDPTPLYFGLLSGATLGGNCTPIGASANITGIGILRRAGYQVSNKDFFRIGIPFTLAAVIPAYLYIWLVFGV